MRITLLRHATLLVEIGGKSILVDPMLDDAGVRAPVRGTPSPRPNPLVPLPEGTLEQALAADAVVVTHTHVDHWDAAAVMQIPKALPLICQPEETADLAGLGFPGIRPLAFGAPLEWDGISIDKTGGRHAHDDDMARGLGPVSGVVLRADGEPTVYLAGDTVWCDEVAEAIAGHQPDWIVVNAGGARFVEGGLITMGAQDVAEVARAAPDAKIVAVHLEAINHCLETRAELADALAEAGLVGRVSIPADGEALE